MELALAVAGSAMFGSTTILGTQVAVGAMVGGMIGAVVDSQFIFPAVFKQKGQEGPRLTDFKLQTASEGSPVNYCLGPENRIAGTLIWAGELIEDKKKAGGGKGGFGGGSGGTYYNYYIHCAVGVCEGPVTSIKKIWADTKLIWEEGQEFDDYWAHSITVYTGTTTQAVDPLIQSFQADTPAYRKLAYVVFNKLRLGPYGNRIPNFTFLVETQTKESTRAAISNILQRGGLTTDDYDLDLVDGIVRGFNLPGLVTSIQALEPLMAAYDVVVQEVNGKLKFITRGHESTVAITADDLAAHEEGQDAPRHVEFLDISTADLPRETNVQFLEPALDYQQGSQRAIKIDAEGDHVDSLDLPLVFDARNARAIASTRLWRQYIERTKVELFIPPHYITVLENDLITFTVSGEAYQARVDKIEEGNNYLHKVYATLVDAWTDLGEGSGYSGGNGEDPADCPVIPPAVIYQPDAVLLTLLLWDIPALSDAHTTTAGYYWALCATDPDAPYAGAYLFDSGDATNYSEVAAAPSEGDIGQATTILADGPTTIWDEANTVTVTMLDGELESVDEVACLNGANRAMLGAELIGYRDATLLSARTYQLSGLLRGLRGTPTTGHAVGDWFCELTDGGVSFQTMNTGRLGLERYYKGVPAGGLVENCYAVAFTCNGGTLKQLAPVNVAGTRDGSNNLTIEWTRRTRALTRLFQSKPLLATEERYEVDVVLSGTVVRTTSVTSPTWTYSAANQTTDGYTPGDPVQVRIYQMNDQIGRGYPAEEIV